ncbi:hypothetical protein RFI_34179, partial [Reticulomyxa filosa]
KGDEKEDDGIICFKFIELKKKNKTKNIKYDLNFELILYLFDLIAMQPLKDVFYLTLLFKYSKDCVQLKIVFKYQNKLQDIYNHKLDKYEIKVFVHIKYIEIHHDDKTKHFFSLISQNIKKLVSQRH